MTAFLLATINPGWDTFRMHLPTRGYPLGALFVLVTLCAVLVAGAAPLVRMSKDEVEPEMFLLALGSGALGGMVVGLIMGLLQFKIGLGMLMGAGVGAAIGAAAGMMSLLSNEQILTAAAAMTAGSGLVVAVSLVMRRST
jgi:uncharacterized membrane protein